MSRWPLEREAQLEALFKDGVKPAEMARHMGITAGALAGKLRRLRRRLGLERPAQVPANSSPPIKFPNWGRCQWPNGDPGRPDFYFCGEPAIDHGPYCERHHQISHGVVRAQKMGQT